MPRRVHPADSMCCGYHVANHAHVHATAHAMAYMNTRYNAYHIRQQQHAPLYTQHLRVQVPERAAHGMRTPCGTKRARFAAHLGGFMPACMARMQKDAFATCVHTRAPYMHAYMGIYTYIYRHIYIRMHACMHNNAMHYTVYSCMQRCIVLRASPITSLICHGLQKEPKKDPKRAGFRGAQKSKHTRS